MSTPEIPDEIMREARNLVFTETNMAKDGFSHVEVQELLARALLARDQRAAEIAYRTCAETRHVSLGDKASAAILTYTDKEQL